MGDEAASRQQVGHALDINKDYKIHLVKNKIHHFYNDVSFLDLISNLDCLFQRVQDGYQTFWSDIRHFGLISDKIHQISDISDPSGIYQTYLTKMV